MSALQFAALPDGKPKGDADLMKMAAELVRDTGISVKDAIQIVKGIGEMPSPRKPPQPSHKARVAAVQDVALPSAPLEVIQPYVDALALLRRALKARLASPLKKWKRCGCSFCTCSTSDGGSWEHRVVLCLMKGHETTYVARTLETRQETIDAWLRGEGQFDVMDFSPGQIEKLQKALSVLPALNWMAAYLAASD